MQMIVMNLLFNGSEPAALQTISPWLDMRLGPLDEIISRLEEQRHRRFIKTHLPLDGLPFFPEVKYVVVGRDVRDVCMSLWNHYRNYKPEFYGRLNETPGRVGAPMPLCPDDVHAFWRGWITRGWFEWESEGFPFWSNMHHMQTWWDSRHLPNVLFVHFNDLLEDLNGEILRVAHFLDIEVSEATMHSTANAASFTTMKANAEQIFPNAANVWEGGAQTFFHSGTTGRWREALTPADLELYRDAVDRVLSPDCASWLERGRLSPAGS